MLHLLQRAVNPMLGLEESVKGWFQISCLLREAPRSRVLKIEKIERPEALLS